MVSQIAKESKVSGECKGVDESSDVDKQDGVGMFGGGMRPGLGAVEMREGRAGFLTARVSREKGD